MTEMTREDLVEAIEEEQVKQTNRVLRWIILMVIGGAGWLVGVAVSGGGRCVHM